METAITTETDTPTESNQTTAKARGDLLACILARDPYYTVSNFHRFTAAILQDVFERKRKRVIIFVRRQQGKRPSTTVARTAIGTKHPLAPVALSTAGGQAIVAKGMAMPIQCPNAAAMWTRRLLEGKSWDFTSRTSRTN